MFFLKKKKMDCVFSGRVTITYYNPNKPHGPQLQAALLKHRSRFTPDDIIVDIDLELPENLPNIHRDIFSVNLDQIKDTDCILIATTNGQILYGDEPVHLSVRAGSACHDQVLTLSPEYDASYEGYTPSSTHIIGTLIKTGDHWCYSPLDLYRPEPLSEFMLGLSQSPMTLHRFHHFMKQSQGESSSAYLSLDMHHLLHLPWLSPNELTQFMQSTYKPEMVLQHGHSLMKDCQIAWDPLLRVAAYRDATTRMLDDGAPWWPKAMDAQTIDTKLAHLLSEKNLAPNWVKLILENCRKEDILNFCREPEHADAVYNSVRWPELLPLLSPKAKRQYLSEDLCL